MNELGIRKSYGQLSKGELYMILAKLDEKHVSGSTGSVLLARVTRFENQNSGTKIFRENFLPLFSEQSK